MSKGLPPVLCLVGPTAVGKSHVAVVLAQRLNAEIINADSRQVFRGLDIATCKLSVEERAGIPHHLLDIVDPGERFSVGQYRKLAVEHIARVHAKGKLALVVGGTGLYIKALVYGLWDGPQPDWDFREHLMTLERECEGTLYKKLERQDPSLAARIHPHDEVRIIRALEVMHVCHQPLSTIHAQHGFREAPFQVTMIGLTRDRSTLYRRIEDRVDRQMAQGLFAEVRDLWQRNYPANLPAMTGLGYRQLKGCLLGQESLVDGVQRLKRDTRRYAKRQMTWFRKDPAIIWKSIATHETVDIIAGDLVKYGDCCSRIFLNTVH
tara:strand:+ start:2080 stop:3042 length:963 start_codon:yes stop_codon:yes gene_type:complete